MPQEVLRRPRGPVEAEAASANGKAVRGPMTVATPDKAVGASMVRAAAVHPEGAS